MSETGHLDADIANQPFLQVHLDPGTPLEVAELTGVLGSLARQYQKFAVDSGFATKGSDARLLVSSVKPGSIDISLVPDFHTIIATSVPLISQIHDRTEAVLSFGRQIKKLLNLFFPEEKPSDPGTTIKDCDDALNIAGPIAQHGGSQTFAVYNGPVHNSTIVSIDVDAARTIVEAATDRKRELTQVTGAAFQRVTMVWSQLARDAARTEGAKSPDKGIIEEIDAKPHPVFFTDETSHLKREMIDDEENPYQKMFFVDVDVSRVPGGKVGNYRVTGYHGKDDYEPGKRNDEPRLLP